MIEKALIQPYLRPLEPLPTQINAKGGLNKPIKCLLCDVYGTLFISSSGDIGRGASQPRQGAQLNTLLAKYELKIEASELLEQLSRAIQGQHAQVRAKGISHPEVVIETVWRQLLPDEHPEKVRRFAVEFEMITNPVWPMPGVEALLSTCRKNNIRLGIISNAQFYTPHLFSWFFEGQPEELGFDPRLTIFSFQTGEAKPSATLFNIAREQLERMAISPASVAYVGNDMRKDIVPAHQAGFQTILFAGDRRSLRLIENDTKADTVPPDMVVTRFDQLTAYLQEPPLPA